MSLRSVSAASLSMEMSNVKMLSVRNVMKLLSFHSSVEL